MPWGDQLPDMALEQEILDFIRTSFRSVWSLELLLHLKRNADRAWTSAELVADLRGSELIVTQSRTVLVTAGLVIVDDQGRVQYRPASAALELLVDQVEAMYSRSPDAVRRLIITGVHSNLSAFADAFRWQKD